MKVGPLVPDMPGFPELKPIVIDEPFELPFTIIIPFKFNEKDAYRQKNLEDCIAYYKSKFPQADIVVAEQYEEKPYFTQQSIKTVQVSGAPVFNRSKLMNLGWSVAQTENLFFCDADFRIPEENVKICLKALEKVDAVRPFKKFVYLGPQETEETLQNKTLFDGDRSQNFGMPLCGGAFFMTREFYKLIGGFDEEFIGWGCEDDAVTLKLINCGKYAVYPGNAVHMYHKKLGGYEQEQDVFTKKNRQRLAYLKNMTDNQFFEYLHKQKESLQKYQTIL